MNQVTPATNSAATSVHTEGSMVVHRFAITTTKPPVLLIHGFASSVELNWVRTGWTRFLNAAGRSVIAIDLPGHGLSGQPSDAREYLPSRIRDGICAILAAECAQYLNKPVAALPISTGIDVVGYSLGSRIAWEVAAHAPELVRRLVLGGPSARDPLAVFDVSAAERLLREGTPIQDRNTALLLSIARLSPGANIGALFDLIRAIATEPFRPEEAVPLAPLLLAAGANDELAASLPELAELSEKTNRIRPHVQRFPARDHLDTLTSRAFKTAVVDFFNAG